MNEADILREVKALLMISDDSVDGALMPRMLGTMEYMKNAGVSDEIISSHAGVVALSIGVNDTWNAPTGAVRFSPVFTNMVTQLQIKSMPAGDGDEE